MMFCSSEKFLKNVIELIKYCVNNHNAQEVKIDFSNCKVYNSPITIGKKMR